MLRRSLAVALLLLTMSGCRRSAATTEVNYTWARLGTPARVLSVAGKPQIVKVMVDGKIGETDANGMILLDEPTYTLYKETFDKEKK